MSAPDYASLLRDAEKKIAELDARLRAEEALRIQANEANRRHCQCCAANVEPTTDNPIANVTNTDATAAAPINEAEFWAGVQLLRDARL